MKTKSAKKEEIQRKWYVVDATDQVAGRLATRIAHVLRGKHNPLYTPHVDTGDHVVVINAEKVRLTGNKETDKKYYAHTGWVGGIVEHSAGELREKHPEQIIEKAVWGMMPKGPLGREMFGKMRVYAGPDHPHSAQKPETLTV